MKDLKEKQYMTPTVKVVSFKVENGFVSMEVKSQQSQTLEAQAPGDQSGQAEGMFRRELGGN
ncbi:MAG: hypothetical protein IKG88_01525 [Bacteroidales bacterium]|nr:hypothetical protein [Bacteroidales bacterium]